MREDPHPEVEGFDYGQGDDRDGAARGGRAAAVSHLRLAEHSPAADEQRAVRYSFPVQSLASPYIAAGATRRDRSSNAISSSDGNGYSSGAAGCNVTAASRLFSRLDMLMLSESSSDDDEDGDDELEYHSLDLEEQSIASDRSADLKRLP